jgi:hypothetical protein
MGQDMYTLHSGRHTYTGTSQELDAIRMRLKGDCRKHCRNWANMHTASPQASFPTPLKKSA